ncbi:uncharacterized protein PHALS_09318 [Plasmopara halstedii]|uniref:Uncharacterized protein n=1 Tax=Plasmopara halstedii TaxID=4781 RepID=A0A0N7L4P7_PLAHL|nr:uncharacterized protein PHALS_09318 [Plasmopara halstedii]CEG39267.1 hypothetical protein PHALS_09318 [Plasmopara halstedii]|eukprot:XP_024575636.1 hypothetical protein PHALS_09318 [Plasmopara halstedii]
MANPFSCTSSNFGVRKLVALFLYVSGDFVHDISILLINQIINRSGLMVWTFSISDFIMRASCTSTDNSLRFPCMPHQHISALKLPIIYRLMIDEGHKRIECV